MGRIAVALRRLSFRFLEKNSTDFSTKMDKNEV